MTNGLQRATGLEKLGTRFGAETVAPATRTQSVRDLFDRIAPRYDRMNDLMSFGLHRRWKRTAARAAVTALAGRSGPLVDLAGGTGDLAAAIRTADPSRPLILVDPSAGMLEIARRRLGPQVQCVQAPGEDIPLADACAAGLTLSFGLRNMTDPVQALAEVARILQPGGGLVLLEFSKPSAWFAPFYALHARLAIPLLARMVARDKGAYRYLVDSIRQFPAADDVARALGDAGLQVVSTQRFLFGVAVLHRAVRP